jgi:hypothetical protein
MDNNRQNGYERKLVVVNTCGIQEWWVQWRCQKKIMATKWLLQMWLETHKWCLTNLKQIGDIVNTEISCENNRSKEWNKLVNQINFSREPINSYDFEVILSLKKTNCQC